MILHPVQLVVSDLILTGSDVDDYMIQASFHNYKIWKISIGMIISLHFRSNSQFRTSNWTSHFDHTFEYYIVFWNLIIHFIILIICLIVMLYILNFAYTCIDCVFFYCCLPNICHRSNNVFRSKYNHVVNIQLLFF